MIYDLWLLQGSGGPYDDSPADGEEFERAAAEFHALPPRTRYKLRRGQKASTRRRIRNQDWAARQLRRDLNFQAIY